jgi:hypothetical protein
MQQYDDSYIYICIISFIHLISTSLVWSHTSGYHVILSHTSITGALPPLLISSFIGAIHQLLISSFTGVIPPLLISSLFNTVTCAKFQTTRIQ